MPYDYPKPLTNNTREDINMLWDTMFQLVEKLRLEEEARAKEAKQG